MNKLAKLTILFTLLSWARAQSCDCGWRNQNAMKIVGGNETGVNEFPAMAALIYLSTSSLICGAHIISSRYLLTAGHCVYQKSPLSLAVLVGDHDITTGTDTAYSALYLVDAYEINPGYTTSYDNDIAILRTATAIAFSTYVAPICLPFKYSTESFAGDAATILGWGQIEFSGPTSNVLLGANLAIISNTDCSSLSTETIQSYEMCTYTSGKDSCQADSGGPVLWTDTSVNRMYLIGIISHGVGCDAGYPGINTRVTEYLSWIVNRTSDVSYCNK